MLVRTYVRLSSLAVLAAGLCVGVTQTTRAQTPRVLWEKRIVHAPSTAVASSGDTLWVAGTERKLLALDARTGKRYWRRNLPGLAVAPILVAGDRVLVGVGPPSPSAVALRHGSGRPVWAVRLPSTPVSFARHGEILIVATTKGTVHGLALSDGAALWERSLDRPIAGMAGRDSLLWVLARSDSLWCLGVKNGTTRWVARTQGVHAAAPTVADSILLCVGYEGTLSTFGSDRGDERARVSTGSPQIAPAAVHGDRVALIATGGEMEVFGLPHLEKLGSMDLHETAGAGVLSWGDWWVVPSQAGRVFGTPHARSTTSWTLEFRTPISFLPAGSGNRMAVIDEKGRLVVYTIDSGS